MKLIQFLFFIGLITLFSSCTNDANELEVIISKSFPEKQITLDSIVFKHLCRDSEIKNHEPQMLENKLEDLISKSARLRNSNPDSLWSSVSKDWEDFNLNFEGVAGYSFIRPVDLPDSIAIPVRDFVDAKWAAVNAELLKFSGQVKFADVLEKLLYESSEPVLTEEFLKSIIYTHIDDQIFVNIFCTSVLKHNHTTGGTISISQTADYRAGNEIILKTTCSDVRYLDVFIRIPRWAVNPTVQHGNVKYVAYPGEYCQISRKWNNGDEIQIKLKN